MQLVDIDTLKQTPVIKIRRPPSPISWPCMIEHPRVITDVPERISDTIEKGMHQIYSRQLVAGEHRLTRSILFTRFTLPFILPILLPG